MNEYKMWIKEVENRNMVYKVTRVVKMKLSDAEEKERILGNLKRLHSTEVYPTNNRNEFINNALVKVCGLDKSGLSKVIRKRQYPNTVTMMSIEECRLRNYCVVECALKDIIGYGEFEKLMPYDDFLLYSRSGVMTWGVPMQNDLSRFNSVEICHFILTLIKKRVILNSLEGYEKNEQH